MKKYLVTDIDIPGYAINKKFDGYAFSINASNLFGANGIGFNGSFMATLRNKIKAANKEFTIGIIFGMNSGNAIYNKFPFLEFVHKHHKGLGNPTPIKVPVFFNEGYLQRVEETVKWFSKELQKDAAVKKLLTGIKITGINSTSLELWATPQDWINTTDTMAAYTQAAVKWKGAGYTTELAESSSKRMIDVFKNAFPGKDIIQAYIPGLNSFPTLDNNGNICPPGQRPRIIEKVINYGNQFSNFKSQYTAFSFDTELRYPDKFVQVNELFYESATLEQFQAMLDHAENAGIENLEFHAQNILRYPECFN